MKDNTGQSPNATAGEIKSAQWQSSCISITTAPLNKEQLQIIIAQNSFPPPPNVESHTLTPTHLVGDVEHYYGEVVVVRELTTITHSGGP